MLKIYKKLTFNWCFCDILPSVDVFIYTMCKKYYVLRGLGLFMRIKILKKVLAVMLAGAVAVATPGLSVSVVASGKGKKSAAKKATKKKKNKQKEEKKEDEKIEGNKIEGEKIDFISNSSEKFQLGFIDFDPHINSISSTAEQEDGSKFVELLEKGLNNEQDTKDFVNIFHKLLTTTNFFEKFKEDNRLKFIKSIQWLLQCHVTDENKGKIVQIIGELSAKNLLKVFSKKDVQFVAEWILKCPIDNNIKKDLSEALEKLITHDFWPKSNQKAPISKLINVLEKCLDVDEARENVLKIIKAIINDNIINSQNCGCEVSNIINILKNCETEEVDARNQIASLIDLKLFFSSPDFYSRDDILIMVQILDECSNSDNARQFVADAIKKLIERKFLKNFYKNDINIILQILNKCSDSDDARQSVASCISDLSSADLLSSHTKREDIGFIFNILKKCSTLESAKCSVSASISLLAAKDLFKKYDEKFLLFDLLNDCLMDEQSARFSLSAITVLCTGTAFIIDNEKTSSRRIEKIFSFEKHSTEIFKLFKKSIELLDFKPQVAYVIFILAKENFFNGCRLSDVKALVNILEKCACQGRERFLELAIDRLYQGQILKCYKNEQGISNLRDAFSIAGGIKKVLDANPGYSLNDLFQSYGKKYTLDFKSLKLIQITPKQSDKKKKKESSESFVESGQKIILNSLQKILAKENVESDKVLNVLNLMLQDGDGELQKNVMVYCIWNLVDQQRVIFQSKDIPRLIELFKKCVGSDFSNKFVSKTIESLILNDWQGEYSKDWFEELINILSDCSKNNSSKNYVAKAVNMLISKCCVAPKLILKEKMTNADQKLILKIIDILSNCLYDPEENGEFIASSIKNLTTMGLLNEFEKSKISNIFKMLDKCANNNANSLGHIMCAVKSLAQNDSLALKQAANEMTHSDKEFIGILIKLLDKCLASEREDVVWAIKGLYEKNLFGKGNKDQVLNAINVLNKCVSSEGVTTAVIANELIEDLFTKSFLESISDSKQISKITNHLFCFLSQGVSKTVVLNLVKKLIENPEFNRENMCVATMKKIKIYNILNACSDSQDCKSDVLEIMRKLAKNNVLTQKYIFKKENVIKLLNKHPEFLSDNDKKSLLDIITALKDNSWLDLDQLKEDQAFMILKIISEDLDWDFGEIFNPVPDGQIQDDKNFFK